MKILRAAERVAVPWKNGGGVTREVAVWPHGAGFDDFDWRVSIAEVREAGPFSVFADIDRVLTILEGRMTLAFDDREMTLDPHSAPLALAGDAPCFGTPLGGPVTDLNVMVRRGRCRAGVERVSSGAISVTAATILVADASARLRSAERAIALRRFDAVAFDGPLDLVLEGSALAVTVSAGGALT